MTTAIRTSTRRATARKATASRRPRRSPEEIAAEVAELKEQFDAKVLTLVTTEAWAAMLNTAVSLGIGRYSFRNTILIMMQCPHATRVAGYNDWRAAGRQVRKGAKSIRILAPMLGRKKTETPDQGGAANTEPVKADDAKGDAPRRPVGFRTVGVFDISQTDPVDADGNVIPEPETAERLPGVAPDRRDASELWAQLCAYAGTKGYPVKRGDTGAAIALVRNNPREIRVSGAAIDGMAVTDLAHEVAHIECGHVDADHGEYQRHRGAWETEAESVAYVIAAAHGYDPASLSVPYVAGWAGETPEKVAETIRGAAESVVKAAAAILGALRPTGSDQAAEDA